MSESKPQAKFFPAIKKPMLPPGTFNGKTCFITGGGTGIGKSMALMLSGLGAAVAIVGRRQAVIEQTASELSSKTGNKVVGLSCDVRDPAAIKSAVDTVEKQLGLLTVIINNAAGNFVSPTERLSNNAFKTILDIVLNGSVNVTLDIGKRLIAAKQGGSFLGILTTYGLTGTGFFVPSATAKAGMHVMTKSLAAEWGRYGIRFNTIAPGPIHTEGAFTRMDPSGQYSHMATGRIPVGRLGELEEVSNLAAYMLSDYASWMSGETVVFDGGESVYNAGEFNFFTEITNDQWDAAEKMIREAHAKQKNKGKA